MNKSIFLKIFGGYFVTAMLLSLLIFIFSFKTIKSFHEDNTTKNLIDIGTALKLKFVPLLEEEKFGELRGYVEEAGKNLNKRITVIDRDGTVIADSEENPDLMENHGIRPEIKDALTGNTGISKRYSSTINADMLYVALPVTLNSDGSDVSYVIRMSILLSNINAIVNNLGMKIIQIVLIIIFISLLCTFIFSRNLSTPIKDLAAASQQVAEGNFDVKIFLKNKDELKELADRFNFMTSQVKNLFVELSSRKEGIDRIIASIQEGLLVLDSKEKIELVNENFKNITNESSPEGKHYWEIIREPKFGELIGKVRTEKRNVIEKIEINERSYLCSATFLKAKSEIIFVFHDITEIKDLEKVKKDFVINVSHELKTPLTAIKGYVETLEEEEDIKNKRFLEIIKRHTNRLENIIHDLLLLSELEDREEKLEVEVVNLHAIVENIMKIFEDKLKEKGLKLRLSVNEFLPGITADPFKIEQMIINLVDNAIKYSEKGEITVSMVPADGFVRIQIEDQGIGIPKEHLNRIFERFYVVNKARSRNLGGTGLGLSIVKHIVLLHNGKIEVKSIPEKGTLFTIYLPVKPF